MAAYPLVVALPSTTPIAIGAIVLLAGSLQFTAWKERHLACCREAGRDGVPADAGTAWRYGLSLGLHCSQCCVGLMAILLVIGVMNVLAMAVVAAAITVERLAPAGERVARATGAAALGAGLFLIRSEEHTSELQSPCNLVCRLLLEKKKHTVTGIDSDRLYPRVVCLRVLDFSHYSLIPDRRPSPLTFFFNALLLLSLAHITLSTSCG